MNDWRIDAWAVRDGAAFASRREEDSLDATSMVFISVPDLEPVPVGRLSTALSATRRGFQTKFRTLEGREIAFDSLDQIRDLVRRGFLAGGLGPDGSGAPDGGPPLSGGPVVRSPNKPFDSGPDSDGARAYEAIIRETETDEWNWFSPEVDIRKVLLMLGSDSFEINADTPTRLKRLMCGYAEAITINWERRITDSNNFEKSRVLVRWYQALIYAGVWNDRYDFDRFVDRKSCPIGIQLMADGSPDIGRGSHWRSACDPVEVPVQDLLSHAPCPRRASWLPNLSRFNDKILLPICVDGYFETNRFLPELAPAALASMLLTSNTFRDEPAQGRSQALAAALRWLLKQLPTSNLPFEAEDLVSEYAQRQVA